MFIVVAVLALFLGLLSFKIYKIIKFYEQGDLASSQLGTPNPVKPLKTAVVLGGSISGLLTARVLLDHAEKVIVIERKSMAKESSSITAHGSFLHVLLRRGYDIITKMFPGIEMTPTMNDNVIEIDPASDFYWKTEGVELLNLKRGELGWVVHQLQRCYVEELLRKKMKTSYSNIEFKDELKFERYHWSKHSINTISGVYCTKGDDKEARAVKIKADLVVDCMGITSPTPTLLLKQGGYKLETTTITTHLQYVSQLYKNPEGVKSALLYYQPAPPTNLTGAIVFPFSKGVTCLTLMAYNNAPLPREQKDVSEFLQQYPKAIEFLSKCTPICETTSYKKEGTEFRHYEKLNNLKGLIALGDAFINFNPVYGQGQSSAAEQVFVLDTLLRGLKKGEPLNCQLFQERAKAAISIPFVMAAFGDLRYPKTTTNSKTLKMIAPVAAYGVKKLLLDSSKDPFSFKCFCNVLHMRQGYIWSLLHPRLMWNMLTK